jgi:outer membrane protein OmpA-like peptidoglycan-associated protein
MRRSGQARKRVSWILAFIIWFAVFQKRSAEGNLAPVIGGEAWREDRILLGRERESLARVKADGDTVSLARSAKGGEDSELPEVFFGPGRAIPTPEGRENLLHIAKWLQQHPSVRVIIVGYTDWHGRKVANQILGLRRARMVEIFLLAKGLIPRTQIVGVESFGGSKPVCSINTEDCLASNRRVRIEVLAEPKLSN